MCTYLSPGVGTFRSINTNLNISRVLMRMWAQVL